MLRPGLIKEARLKRGWSQLDLEAASGLTQATISVIERGIRPPTARTLRRLADALGVEPADFFDDEVPASRGEEIREELAARKAS